MRYKAQADGNAADVVPRRDQCGYERMAELQEEILWLCEAAHLPVIWATQVLEQLAKTGLPSRAEISATASHGSIQPSIPPGNIGGNQSAAGTKPAQIA